MKYIFKLFFLIASFILNPLQGNPLFSAEKEIKVYLIGTGVVGSALLDQIKNNKEKLYHTPDIDINIVGLANSQKMAFSDQGIDLNNWKKILNESEKRFSISKFINHIDAETHPVFVDCTSNKEIANAYASILQKHISIVTPNKKANSGNYSSYRLLKELSQENQVKYIYDSNVGAGLPILSTIRGLLNSGDDIIRIEAILSGTLSYLFNHFDENTPFSSLVMDAQKKGYTEPDPRDDLNGMDVARKILIIAREIGAKNLELGDVDLTAFLPDDCFTASSVAEFYSKLKDYDATFEEIRKQADKEGKKLRFIASYENHFIDATWSAKPHGKLAVSLQAVDKDHPFYNLSGNDNIISIHTKYYTNPIVIKGPGAGADVTAARVYEGIISARKL